MLKGQGCGEESTFSLPYVENVQNRTYVHLCNCGNGLERVFQVFPHFKRIVVKVLINIYINLS